MPNQGSSWTLQVASSDGQEGNKRTTLHTKLGFERKLPRPARGRFKQDNDSRKGPILQDSSLMPANTPQLTAFPSPESQVLPTKQVVGTWLLGVDDLLEQRERMDLHPARPFGGRCPIEAVLHCGNPEFGFEHLALAILG